MLRSLKSMEGFKLKAMDGHIGKCRDFLFDDHKWVVRYMVADPGDWLTGRKVLISPIAFREVDSGESAFGVKLKKTQIEKAPTVDENAPVSRQLEIDFNRHYGWPDYWAGADPWGMSTSPELLYSLKRTEKDDPEEASEEDPHLRSANEIHGYSIEASDGSIGHVEDFIVEDDTWMVRYMVVDTRNWLPGRKVLIAVAWVESFDWLGHKAVVDVTRQMVKDSPEYDPEMPVNQEYETVFYDFYGRPHYGS